MSYRRRAICACCDSRDLHPVMEFPATPLANEFVKPFSGPQGLFPLDLVLCSACGHLQLGAIVDPTRLFRDYVFVSGTSHVNVAHFAAYAEAAIARFPQIPPHGLDVVEIGSNDGTLLREFVKRGHGRVLGVDPAVSISEAATAGGIPTRVGFFSSGMAREIVQDRGRVDLVVANNVFAHAEDLQDMAAGARILLRRDGVFVMEVSYLLDVVQKCLFDTIYHEHQSFHALGPLRAMLASAGLRVVDVDRVPTQGGSIRVWAVPSDSPAVERPSVAALYDAEIGAGLFKPETYKALWERIMAAGEVLRNKLYTYPVGGVVGFGAPAKLTTLMYAFGLRRENFRYIIDESPWKQGLFTPGLHIPVVSPEMLASDCLAGIDPDVIVVFAWNFADDIVWRYRGYGGSFLIPLPELREVQGLKEGHLTWL